jgi:HK97 family phage major capsid protein
MTTTHRRGLTIDRSGDPGAANLAELRDKRRRLIDERAAIADRVADQSGPVPDGLLERTRNIVAGIDKVDGEIRDAERDRLDAVVGSGNYRTEGGSDSRDDVDARAVARTADEDRAHRTIDAAFRSKLLPAHAAEKATALLGQGLPSERSLAARWAAAAGAPEYRTAFATWLADPIRGHMLWTPAEAEAYRRVVEVGMEMRSLTTTSGSAMIPLTLDPAIMLTNDGSNNPLRRLATIKQTLTNEWRGVTSAGATSEWKVEEAQVADGSPTLAQPAIPVFFGDSYVPYSFEVGGDVPNFLEELTDVLLDSADNLMATAYTTGNGTTQPQGIVTGLAGTASEINTTGTEAIVASDAYALQNALPARFSANATWQSHIAIANTFRQFETTNGALKFPGLHETPPTLIGKPWFENSNMDGAINAAVTANNYVLIYGDVARGFFIVDRVGSSLETVQHVLGANGRPTGQRGALLWFRTGSEVVVPQALRLLDVPTTA